MAKNKSKMVSKNLVGLKNRYKQQNVETKTLPTALKWMQVQASTMLWTNAEVLRIWKFWEAVTVLDELATLQAR